jgi:hypothetical protein
MGGPGAAKNRDGQIFVPKAAAPIPEPTTRKVRIATGVWEEAMLTNDLCKRIISDAIASRFQRGDFGLTAAINAMIAKSPR